ncbi:MAG: phosphate ABC transporter ATP-binding protein [Candidatus Heimdallarchaeota archaeon]|nr:MAG: phosphate ABC transporter ATP-binding protein [Candidatus Heimdallarchaeota archaeon]
MSNTFNEPECPFCLRNIFYQINSKRILTDINIRIERSGITGIVGPSGSGKSTLLRLLNKLVSPSEGRILLEGQDYNTIPVRELRKRIGLVQQRPYLFPGTVRYNLQYGPKIWEVTHSEETLVDLLTRVALQKEFLDRDVDGLSGGEQQRVSLARSLANKPSVLLLDEPTSSLDIVSEEIIENTVKDLARDGTKIIIVTHSLEQTRRLTDHLLFLKEGRLIETVPTASFFEKYNEEEIRGFFKAKTKEDSL